VLAGLDDAELDTLIDATHKVPPIAPVSGNLGAQLVRPELAEPGN
jgi:hypothetical protein